ncbi:hypothetical protein [Thermocatellispora tengchongensis]
MAPPALSAAPTAPSAANAAIPPLNGATPRPRRSRGPLLAAGAVLVALAVAVGVGVLLVPSWLAGDAGSGEKAQAGPSAVAPLVIGDKAYPAVGAADGFDGPAGAGYDGYQPFAGEALPVVKSGGGRLTGEGTAPFYGWFALPAAPSSGDAVSLITVGGFAGAGEAEDSVFAGLVKDQNNYIGAWYNNTRKEIGIDVRVNGEFRHTANSAALSLAPGDRLALVLSGGTTVTSYAETGGSWRRLTTVGLGDLLATPQERALWRHGFALRATTGTIALDSAEGRGAAG